MQLRSISAQGHMLPASQCEGARPGRVDHVWPGLDSTVQMVDRRVHGVLKQSKLKLPGLCRLKRTIAISNEVHAGGNGGIDVDPRRGPDADRGFRVVGDV